MVSLANPPVTVTGALPPPAHPAGLKALSSTDTVNGVTCQPSCDSHGCLAASYLACITITYEGEITVMWLQLASFLDKNLSPLESIPATCLTHLTAIISAALYVWRLQLLPAKSAPTLITPPGPSQLPRVEGTGEVQHKSVVKAGGVNWWPKLSCIKVAGSCPSLLHQSCKQVGVLSDTLCRTLNRTFIYMIKTKNISMVLILYFLTSKTPSISIYTMLTIPHMVV